MQSKTAPKSPVFRPVDKNVSFPQQEAAVLEFWRAHGIYEKSLQQRHGAAEFVFYEGPPTANGLPHPGHCLTRAIKDLFPRYRTMRGFHCQRKAGWDTHGLPVEVEVCKALGIHSKEEIEQFGVEPFVQKCQQSVWRYMKEWERITERLGFWIKLDDAYVTYHQSYVESVWWSLKNLFDRGLLYQGYKIVWWWAQGGTALSAGEVGQGYRSVDDPSVFVLFPLLDRPDTSLLVWTTTPWTLPSNQFAAVHPQIEYATVYDAQLDRQLIMASGLVETISGKVKRPLEVRAICSGEQLVGLRYEPPFDFFYKTQGDETGQLLQGPTQHRAWRVLAADFVTTDSGTGAVHEAPAFGEVDFDMLLAEQARFVSGQGPEMICAVDSNGKFNSHAPTFEGKWVKDADKLIVRALRDNGRLYHQEQYRHEYPFCWRAEEDPLIQYPRKSWFIRTTQFREKMLENNSRINWLPGHIRHGRFGNFLETNVDWALSRERYWGTPLPIWVCETTGRMEAVASYDQLLAKPGVGGTEVWQRAKADHPELPDDLRVHKPYIDALHYDSPFAAGSRMRRVSEVIDCWYDSGAMPFAQWAYPQQGQAEMRRQFPADFISEALDQTRGWFYSLLAISTLLFSEPDLDQPHDSGTFAAPCPHPYRNCIVLGLMLSEVGVCSKCQRRFTGDDTRCDQCGGQVERRVEKMSKSKRNYSEPGEIFDRYGADALRWYLFANQPPWNSIIYSERAIKESIPEFLLRLWNVYRFFIEYANIDGFSPKLNRDGSGQLQPGEMDGAAGFRPVSQRNELDRWILSELHRTIESVTERMDAYDNFAACQALNGFVDGLSNWYVRRSRDRFWSSATDSADKLDGYWTLYQCLVSTVKMIAPFVPFLAETIWQNLIAGQTRAVESVHLCDFPSPQPELVDQRLSDHMGLLREIASLGRSARMEARLKVRQPLASVTVVLADPLVQPWLEQHDQILREELNVQQIHYTTDPADLVSYLVQPNFRRLGPRVGKLMPKVKQAIIAADGAEMLQQLNETGTVVLQVDGTQVTLDNEDLQVRLQAREGSAAAQGRSCVVVLSTELTPSLLREGLARDVIRSVQQQRKDIDLQYTDRIQLRLLTESTELRKAIEENARSIVEETLTRELLLDDAPDGDYVDVEIGSANLRIQIKVVPCSD